MWGRTFWHFFVSHRTLMFIFHQFCLFSPTFINCFFHIIFRDIVLQIVYTIFKCCLLDVFFIHKCWIYISFTLEEHVDKLKGRLCHVNWHTNSLLKTESWFLSTGWSGQMYSLLALWGGIEAAKKPTSPCHRHGFSPQVYLLLGVKLFFSS